MQNFFYNIINNLKLKFYKIHQNLENWQVIFLVENL